MATVPQTGSALGYMPQGGASTGGNALNYAQMGIGAVTGGIESYLKWKEMEEQKRRQAANDSQMKMQNSFNIQEYLAGNPMQQASRDNAIGMLNYQKSLAGLR